MEAQELRREGACGRFNVCNESGSQRHWHMYKYLQNSTSDKKEDDFYFLLGCREEYKRDGVRNFDENDWELLNELMVLIALDYATMDKVSSYFWNDYLLKEILLEFNILLFTPLNLDFKYELY